jgi:hypothetical protein
MQKVMKQVLRGLAVMLLSAFVTIEVSSFFSLGAFNLSTLPDVMGFAVLFALGAWLAYNIIGFIVTNMMSRIKNPGVMLMTVLSLAANTVALLILGSALPSVVTMSVASVPIWALAATAAFWVGWTLGAACRLLPAVKTLFPER